MPDWFTPWQLTADALAVYRLTRFITADHLPIGPLRDWVSDHYPGSLAEEWMGCAWCAGVPTATAVLGLHALAPHVWPYVAVVLAFSAVTGLLTTWEHQQ